METVFAIKGKDFVLVAADSFSTYSLFRLKHDEDKIMEIDKNKLLALAGPVGDRAQFGEYIRKNIHLHRLRTGIPLGTHAAAHFTRKELAEALRSNPFMVNMLMTGFDQDGPALFWLDMYGSMVAVDKGAHGYGAYFVNGLLDRHFRPDMSKSDALEMIQLCINEMSHRFLVSQGTFIVKSVDESGVHTQVLTSTVRA